MGWLKGRSVCLCSLQFLLVWIVLGLVLLAQLAEIQQAGTYEDVMGRVCGPLGRVLADVSVVLYGFGTNTAFLVVIGDQLQDCECVMYMYVSLPCTLYCKTSECIIIHVIYIMCVYHVLSTKT